MQFRQSELMLLALICVTLTLLVYSCQARATRLNHRQQFAVQYALAVGGPTEVFIIGQESSFCHSRIGDHGTAFGCGQLHCQAARVVTDHCYIHRLIHDDRYSIDVSTAYYWWCYRQTGDFNHALLCYNHGIVYARRCGRRCVMRDRYLKAISRRVHNFTYHD